VLGLTKKEQWVLGLVVLLLVTGVVAKIYRRAPTVPLGPKLGPETATASQPVKP
jgi:hypothetical protein